MTTPHGISRVIQGLRECRDLAAPERRWAGINPDVQKIPEVLTAYYEMKVKLK